VRLRQRAIFEFYRPCPSDTADSFGHRTRNPLRYAPLRRRVLPELPKSRAVPASRTPHAASVFDRPSLSQMLVATRRPCALAESYSFARLVPTRLRKDPGFEITCVRSGNSQKARSTSLPQEFPLPLRRSLCVFLSPERRAVTGSRTPHAAIVSARYVSLATADAVLARYRRQDSPLATASLRSLEHDPFP